MNFIKVILLFYFTLSMNACALFKASPHDKMIAEIKNYTYPLSFVEMKQRVLNSIPKMYSFKDSKFIVLTTTHPNYKLVQNDLRISQNWYYNFKYKKYYIQSENDHLNLNNIFSVDELKKYTQLGQEDYFVMIDKPGLFQFSQNQYIITVESINEHSSRLKIEGLTRLKFEGLSDDQASHLCSSEALNEMIDIQKECFVDLDKSLNYKTRLLSKELEFLYYIAPAEAKKMEL